jgi:hypothetical protein
MLRLAQLWLLENVVRPLRMLLVISVATAVALSAITSPLTVMLSPPLITGRAPPAFPGSVPVYGTGIDATRCGS